MYNVQLYNYTMSDCFLLSYTYLDLFLPEAQPKVKGHATSSNNFK